MAGERSRLQQILANLVGNAIKFTRQGGVTVRLRAAAEAQPESVEVAVEDTGPGMSPDEARHAFDRFWHGGSADEARPSGTGLGLYIVRGLVEAHGGRVRVESRPGRGATFSFTVPVAVGR